MDCLLQSIANFRLSDTDTAFRIDVPGAAITKPFLQPTSINSLPPEILLEIFLFCGLPDKKRPKHKALEVSVHISRVCHRWRKISLGCSEIWARCFCVGESSRRETKMILRRVKNNGINFVLPQLPPHIHPITGQMLWPCLVDFWRKVQNGDLLDRAMSKSRRFAASLTTADGTILQWGPIKQRLSQLATVSLELTDIGECLILDHSGLYDTEARAHWSTRSLNLVRTCLTGLDGSNVALTPQRWLDVLAELPRLRRLTLQDAMKDCQTQFISSTTNNEELNLCLSTPALSDVCLPLLELLDIGSGFNQCTEFLRKVVVPASCDIFIYIHSLWEMYNSAFSSMVSWIQKRFDKDEATLGQSLFMQMTEHSFAIRNSTSPVFNLQVNFMREYDAEGNVLHIAAFTPDELFHALVAPFALPCRYVTDLKLFIDCEYDATEHQNFWAHTFTPFVSVECLSLLSHDSFCFMVPICETGGFVVYLHFQEWKKMALFPKLQTLSSRDVNFIDPVSEVGNVSLSKKLLNLVKLRKMACLRGLVSNIQSIYIRKGHTGKQPKRKDYIEMASYGVRVF